MISMIRFLMLVSISILCFEETYSQKRVNSENNKENLERHEAKSGCERGKSDAEQDFMNDDLGYYFYGLPNPRFNTWMRLIREAYDLKVKGGGCIIEEEGACYNQVMREKLKEKFGNYAFERIERKVDSLYQIGLGDKEAKFGVGDSELLKYIYCNLEDHLLSSDKMEVPIVVIQISISEEGKVDNQQILFRNKFAEQDGRYENKAIELIKSMPDWVPAIENRKKVRSGYNIPIRFAKEMKNKNCN